MNMCGCNKSGPLCHFVWNKWTTIIWIILLQYTTGYTPTARLKNKHGLKANQPNFLATKQNYTVSTDHLAVLSCAVQQLGTKTVVWRKVSEPNPLTVGKVTFVADSRIQTHHVVHKDQWNLHIRNVGKSDAGAYECQISTKDRNLRKIFYLKVVDNKVDDRYVVDHSGIMITGNFHVEIGDTLHMTCNATESDIPLEDIAWFKDGTDLEGSDRVRIYKKLSLKGKTIKSDIYIDRVDMSDTGYYLCRTTDHLTTHKHVQVLNTAVNKDKRGTAIDTLVSQEQKNKGNNSSATLPGKVLIFIAFLFDFLRNAL